MPQVMGSEIRNCTYGRTGLGLQGDTCVVTYRRNSVYQVDELWYCQDTSTWTITSGNQIFTCNYVLLIHFIEVYHVSYLVNN